MDYGPRLPSAMPFISGFKTGRTFSARASWVGGSVWLAVMFFSEGGQPYGARNVQHFPGPLSIRNIPLR